MRPTRVTLGLLLAGLAAVGCSKGAAARESEPAAVKPRTTASESVLKKQTNGNAHAAIPSSANVTSASFADGEAAYRARKYGDATTIFERYTSQQAKDASGHYMLGMSAWKSNDWSKAEKAFDAALALDPLHVKSLMNLSRVLIDQKRYEEALDRLTRAKEIDPASNEVHRLLGRVLYAQDETEAAVEAYRRAIELDERDVWSMNNLGLLFIEERRADEALPLLTRAVELRKDVPAFRNNLGMALEQKGRVEDAVAEYTAAISVDPRYDRARQNLARLDALRHDRDR